MFRAVTTPAHPVVLAITGASGAPYAVRLLETLATHHVPSWLLVSTHGWRLLAEECGIKDEAALRKATGDWDCIRLFNDADRGAQPASGSVQTMGMVVCPCSMGTMAAIAQGTSRSLIERAADVTLKERRRLVLVPRETPLSLVHLRDVTPELYREIRELWKTHSIAEDKRDIAGLIATLTPDCVYEVVGEAGARWEGHAGATRFYTSLLSAFPDIHFALQTIVIGPQGVCEEARVTGTHKAK